MISSYLTKALLPGHEASETEDLSVEAGLCTVQEELALFGSSFSVNSQASVEGMWNLFKDRIHTIIEERVLPKCHSSGRHIL